MHERLYRKIALWAFIAFLVLTAAIALVVVLVGDMDKTDMKILATTSTISAVCMYWLAGLTFMAKRSAPPAMVGIILATAAAVLFITAIWAEIQDDTYWKTFGVTLTVALAIAHCFLVCFVRLARTYRWLRWGTLVLLGLLAGLICMAIIAEVSEEYVIRMIVALSIVVVLGTLVVLILSRVKSTPALALSDKLILTRLNDDLYVDSAGQRYEVRKKSADRNNA